MKNKTDSSDWISTFIIMFIICLLIVFASCKPVRYLDKHHDEICIKCIDEYAKKPFKDTVIVRFDTVRIQGDGETNDVYQMLLLECDSVGQVSIKTLYKAQDSLKRSMSDVQVLNRIISSYYIKNNMLFINNKVLNDSITKLLKIIEINKAPIIIEKPAKVIEKTPLEAKIAIWSLLFIVIILSILYLKKLIFS